MTELKYDYKLKGKDSKLKVMVTEVKGWHVKAIRSDNGEEDTFPILYFQKQFIKID